MTLTYFWGHRGQFKHENLQFFACKHDNSTNINCIGPKLIPWMYLRSVLVKLENGWTWPIFEVTGVNLNMKICNFLLVNTITQQILIALGPNLSHGCISGVSWLSLKMDELDLYVEVIGLISKLNLFHYKHDKHVTQSILVALIPNLYHGCISSSKMDDLDLSFFVRKCMFMTSPHSARRWIAWGAGNMHSSYYKWNMAIICNPPIMLCATFVPCCKLACFLQNEPWVTRSYPVNVQGITGHCM